MKVKLILLCCFCIVISYAGETAKFLWSDSLNDITRWRITSDTGYDLEDPKTGFSNGTLFLSAAEENNAIRFDSELSAGGKGALWLSPEFRLLPMESLAGATEFKFEAKFEQNDHAGFRFAYLAFCGEGQPELRYGFVPSQTGKFTGYRLSLSPKITSKYNRVIFYLASSGSHVSCQVRNMEISGKGTGCAETPAIDAALAVRSAAPGMMFIESEPLKFQFVIPRASTCVISDLYGKELRTMTVFPGENVLPQLPNGYYFLSLSSPGCVFDGRRGFAVVPPRAKLPAGCESPFAMVGAITDLGKPMPAGVDNPCFPGTRSELMCRIANRAGLYQIREGTNWKKGYDFLPQHVQNARYMEENGLRQSHVIIPCGASMSDLRDIHQHSKVIAATFRNSIGYLEFWNEPEAFGKPAAWNYAAAAKAAFLGVKAGVPEMKVMSASFLTEAFPRIALKSELGRYFDIFNIHVYSEIRTYQKRIAQTRKLLKEFDISNKPIHITECSTFAGNQSGRLKSFVPNMQVQDLQQEITHAEFVIKSQIVMQSLGVSAVHSFIFPPYNECGGLKDWGLMRYDNTAKPSLAAFAALSHELAAATCLGTYRTVPGVRGYLFSLPDGTQTLALWNETWTCFKDFNDHSENHPKWIDITQKSGQYRFRDEFGFSKDIKTVNGKLRIAISDQVSYVSGLHGLRPTQKAQPRHLDSKVSDGGIDGSVVLNILGGSDFPVSDNRLYSEPQKRSGKIKLHIYNLSDEEKSGTLSFQNGSVSNPPGPIVLSPFGKVELELEITPALLPKQCIADFKISGIFNGKSITPAVMPVNMPWAVQTSLVPLKGILAAKNWNPLASGRSVQVGEAPQDNAIEIIADFTGQGMNTWLMPIFTLSEPGALKGAIGLEFDIWVRSEKPLNSYANIGLCGKVLEYTPPPLERWTKVRVFFSGQVDVDELEHEKTLTIGLQPKDCKVSYKLRNVNAVFIR